jgi:aminomuconate-semialdehyde/2-hydroxymuconate-6-semialdehyde dehydrogenase
MPMAGIKTASAAFMILGTGPVVRNGFAILFIKAGANENISPVDGRVVNVVHEAGADEVDAAVAAARRALAGPWAGLSIAERADVLYAVADGISARFDDFLDAEVADTGKPVSLASHIDIPRGAANFKVFADQIKSQAGEFFETATPDGRGAINYSVRLPKGVIGVICPWNLPLLLMTWKVGPALACGNAVVVKPSEETPTTAALLGEVMNGAGVPPGVYNVIHGFGPGSAGELLTQHPGVDAITFTGETVTGEAIMRNAAIGVRDVSFELGGKNPGIVFADCDFDAAIEGTMRSAFANCGQVCLGTERVYVERPIFDRFVAALKEKAEALRPGRPEDDATTIGPLISQVHRDKVLSYYEKARAEGATVITGGGVPEMADGMGQGSWVEPTIWTGLAESSPVVREEVFGRGGFRPLLPHPAVRRRGRGGRDGQCQRLWPGDRDLVAGHCQSQPRRQAGRGRDHLGKLLVPARPAHALRRRQAVRDRPRGRRPFDGVLHRTP